MSLRLRTFGAWGVPDAPALAFDLLGPRLWKGARLAGVRRLSAPTASAKDAAPAILSYGLAGALVKRDGFSLASGAAALSAQLVASTSPLGGGAGVSFLSGKALNPHRFTVNHPRQSDDPVSLRFYVEEAVNPPVSGASAKEVQGHVWFVRMGGAGNGVLIRVRDGNAEVCRLSKDWTQDGQEQLHTLYALDSPTSAQRDQTTALEKSIYSQVDSIEGRDTWRGVPARLTLIPEPVEPIENEVPTRRLHIITENSGKSGMQTLEYAPDTNEAPDPKAATPLVWNSQTEVGATGGEWHLEWNGVAFDRSGTMEWGPFYSGFFPDSLGDLKTAVLAGIPLDALSTARGGVTFEKFDTDEGRFGLRAKLTSTDGKTTPFLHGVSARTLPGPRDAGGDGEASFDTDALYTRAGESEAREKSPLLEVEISGAATGERSAKVDLRDVKGNTLGGKSIDDLLGRVARLDGDGGPLLADALIISGSHLDLAHFAYNPEGGGLPQRGGIRVSKNKSRFSLGVSGGHTLLKETLCDPSPVGDGKRLGAQFRALLRICSFSDAQMAGVPEDFGPVLPKGNSRDGFACVPDASSSVQSALDGLLDRFGLGLRFYQDELSVWHLETRPKTVIAQYQTSRAAGRYCVLAPLNFERSTDEFFNSFRVVGGSEDVSIVRTFLDKASLRLAGGGLTHPRYLGRLKRYPALRDEGLKTVRAVNYALRSLLDIYNIPGRTATLESYFERPGGKLFAPRDRVTVDGVLCEVLDWQGSEARDRLRLTLREVV